MVDGVAVVVVVVVVVFCFLFPLSKCCIPGIPHNYSAADIFQSIYTLVRSNLASVWTKLNFI